MTSPTTASAELPACIVFALEEYSMLLYDGGPDDCDVYLRSHIRLFKPFPAEQAIGFVGYVDRIVQYQQDFAVLAVLPQHCPGQQVLLAVRYRKLGGISGYLATIVAKLRGVAGYLHPNNTRAIPIEDPLPPLSPALQSRWFVELPSTMPMLWVGTSRRK